jgi:hypothetical protein
VIWTGTTKSGCAGQYTNCFSDGNENSLDGARILTSDNGGACVGFALSGDEFITKTMPCEKKCFFACQSLHTAIAVVNDVIHKVFVFSFSIQRY